REPASPSTCCSLSLCALSRALSLSAPSVDKKRFVELRCMCLNTVSGIHPSNIQNLEVLRAGPHCANVEVIATLRNGKKICLDPEAPKIKKIVQKILESSGSTVPKHN
uniref:C-X-C motif chemokine n=1 Tax=Neovison vison TaxID=452646 RepID=A0A8C7B813_NEOVI